MKNKLGLCLLSAFVVLAITLVESIVTAQVVLESKTSTVSKERQVGVIVIDFNEDGSIAVRGDLVIVQKVDGLTVLKQSAGSVVLTGKELDSALVSQDLPQSPQLATKLKAILEAKQVEQAAAQSVAP